MRLQRRNVHDCESFGLYMGKHQKHRLLQQKIFVLNNWKLLTVLTCHRSVFEIVGATHISLWYCSITIWVSQKFEYVDGWRHQKCCCWLRSHVGYNTDLEACTDLAQRCEACRFSPGNSGVGSIFGNGGRQIQCEAPKQIFTAPPAHFAGGQISVYMGLKLYYTLRHNCV